MVSLIVAFGAGCLVGAFVQTVRLYQPHAQAVRGARALGQQEGRAGAKGLL